METSRSSAGHTIALLDIENRLGQDVVVDLNGSYLVPKVELYQRLGLGLLRARSDLTEVRLKPGARLQVKVLSVCMESAKGSPGEDAEYRLAKRLAPKKILRILRRWKTRPGVPH